MSSNLAMASPWAASFSRHILWKTWGMYTIREKGKNGTVEITSDFLIRTIKKRFRGDRETIPIRAITSVRHDRKVMKTDDVQVVTSGQVWEWKVKDAEKFVAELNQALASG